MTNSDQKGNTVFPNIAHDYRAQVSPILKEIIKLLERICGPTAGYCSKYDYTNGIHEFTHDGIDTVRALKTKPFSIEESVKSIVAYIGNRVEIESHDGTTTAMLLFCYVVNYAIKRLHDASLATATTGHLSRKISPKLIAKALDTVLDKMTNIINDNKLLVSDIMALLDKTSDEDRLVIRKFISSSIARISSKNDQSLVDTVVKYTSAVPVEINDGFKWNHNTMESDTDGYEVNINKHQWFMGHMGYDQLSINNSDLNTTFKDNSCSLWICNTAIVEGSLEEAEVDYHLQQIIAKMESGEFNKDNMKTIIFIAVAFSAHAHGHISALNMKLVTDGYKARIIPLSIAGGAIINNGVYKYNGAYVRSLQLIIDHNTHNANTLPSITYVSDRDIQVELNNGYVMLNNLFDVKETDLYHPFYHTDETEKPMYHKFIREVREKIASLSGGYSTEKINSDEIAHLKNILSFVTNPRMVSIHINGSTHFVQAGIPVLKDAVGSVIKGLTEGVVFDALTRLYIGLSEFKRRELANIDTKNNQCILDKSGVEQYNYILAMLTDAFIYGLSSIICVANNSQSIEMTEDVEYMFLDKLVNRYTNEYNVLTTNNADFGYMSNCTGDDTALVQPVSTYISIFKRYRELMKKMLCTEIFVQADTIS